MIEPAGMVENPKALLGHKSDMFYQRKRLYR